jgi:hypothetical protein
MSTAARIKSYCQFSIDATFNKFCLLNDNGVFDPQHVSSLTAAKKRGSLRAVCLIQDKLTPNLRILLAPTAASYDHNSEKLRHHTQHFLTMSLCTPSSLAQSSVVMSPQQMSLVHTSTQIWTNLH